jgi:hypothetical protein
MPKYEYAGVMPGSVTVGDIIQNTQALQKPSRMNRPAMMARKKPMQSDAIRTTVDFQSTPMMKSRMR